MAGEESRSPESLEARLNRLSLHTYSVEIRTSRRCFLSFKAVRDGTNRTNYLVTLDESFLTADDFTLLSLVKYIEQKDRASLATLRAYSRANKDRASESSEKDGQLHDKGRVYNLKRIYERLNETYFARSLNLKIGWSRCIHRTDLRSIRLGTYHDTTKTIRIHPFLDQTHVPSFFIDYVIYHEMLHAAVGIKEGRIHNPRFKRLEKMFANYDRAVRWQKENLSVILKKPQMSLFESR